MQRSNISDLGRICLLLLVASVICSSAVSPTRASQSCNIVDFGAVGDNATDSTLAIQAALSNATCTAVIVPSPGFFVSKSISLALASGKTLVIEPGAALVVWRNISEYGQGDFLTTPGLLINFTLTGGGAIIGGGATWWPYGKSIFRPRILGAYNVSGLIVSNLTFLDSPFWNMSVDGNACCALLQSPCVLCLTGVYVVPTFLSRT